MERSPCGSRFPGSICDPVKDPHCSSLFLKDCILWKGPMLDKFMKDCSMCVGPHTDARKKHEEEGASGTDCNPHSSSSCGTWVGKMEESELKLSLGKMKGWAAGVFGFVSYHPTLF